MNATRKDLVRFVSDVRLELEGPDGVLNDAGGLVQLETCERLVRKLRVTGPRATSRVGFGVSRQPRRRRKARKPGFGDPVETTRADFS